MKKAYELAYDMHYNVSRAIMVRVGEMDYELIPEKDLAYIATVAAEVAVSEYKKAVKRKHARIRRLKRR